ncbi:hypothetical protein HY230_02875 [Candidatus Acetothermia bacterium]|nr:hypothetical protein [Candidatus Acetothermia bacterium]
MPISEIESRSQKQAKCPFCQSTNTELYSLFGSTLSTSQYYCKNCRTVFEQIKWE